jgi:hypothetical protein
LQTKYLFAESLGVFGGSLAFTALGLLLSARTLVSQHGVPKPGLWKGFSGAPTAAKAAVGYLGLEGTPGRVKMYV